MISVKNKVLLVVMVLVGSIFILALWGNNVETWNSLCAYKREFGVFPYYVTADLSNADNACGETGVVYSGLFKTILTSLITLAAIRLAGVKILGK